ncbi:MAG: Obg family GTPase CgtA [Oscillospiraceae bacterium]|nr:Obg family GTPase CgtA [Oscillospiraceae bacterium]
MAGTSAAPFGAGESISIGANAGYGESGYRSGGNGGGGSGADSGGRGSGSNIGYNSDGYGADGVLYTVEQSAPRFVIETDGGDYVLTGQWLKKLVADTNFNNHESVQYFQTMLKKYGIIDALEKRGIIEGATVKIYDIEFDYIR